MSYQEIFKRYEYKYLLTQEEKKKLEAVMSTHMEPDKYFKSDIRNIYYDTPTKQLIRDSIIKPSVYKEKLRVRSYGQVEPDEQVFVEIKKKFQGIVYKRRISLEEQVAAAYLNENFPLEEPNQISREIDYFKKHYAGLEPAMFLAYERESYASKTDAGFRMTFDENIITRQYDLSLASEVYGEPDLLDGRVILEVKTPRVIPKWLVDFFSENEIYKASFSKYGRAYLDHILTPYLKEHDLLK